MLNFLINIFFSSFVFSIFNATSLFNRLTKPETLLLIMLLFSVVSEAYLVSKSKGILLADLF